MDSIRTDNDKIEAYVFEQHIDAGGIDAIKSAMASAPGVGFIAQFVGAFNLFARVVADDVGQLQRHIKDDYYRAGIRSDWSVNLTGKRILAPKRGSPDICALVCVQATVNPFDLLLTLDAHFGEVDYGAAVVTAANFDVLVDLGADTIEQVMDRVMELRATPGIGRTATAVADLADDKNAIRPSVS